MSLIFNATARANRKAVTAVPWRRRALFGTIFVLASLIFTGFGHVSILRGIASFLVVEDSLEPAAAIVALNGRMPFREIEAAKLHNAGWAPVLVIVKGWHLAHSKDLQDLGLPIDEAWKVGREVILRQGVPPTAIVLLKDQPSGTLGELQSVARALTSTDLPVILVTSAVHTRRVRATWEHVTRGQSRPIVRVASDDPFDPERWWQQPGFFWAVVHEYLGLINYYAGFPLSGRAALNQSQ